MVVSIKHNANVKKSIQKTYLHYIAGRGKTRKVKFYYNKTNRFCFIFNMAN